MEAISLRTSSHSRAEAEARRTESPQEEQASWRIDLDDSERLVRGISELFIAPMRNGLYYIFPFLASYSYSAVEMKRDDPTQYMFPTADKISILNEIDELKQAAGIKRKVTVYGLLSHSFLSYGGSLSLTSPSLFFPYQHAFRAEKHPFTKEDATDGLNESRWHFTDDETRFLLARELSNIRGDNSLIRLAVKVTLLAAAFVFYATPIGWIGGLALAVAAIALYIFSEKQAERLLDLNAVRIVAKRTGDFKRSKDAALSAIQKLIDRNLEKRRTNKLCRLYITKKGNNTLDFNHPFLTSRYKNITSLEQ